MKKKYNILLADLDNTLLDFTASELSAVSRLLEYFGTFPSKELTDAYSAYNDSLWKRLEKGEITRSQLIDTRFTAFFKDHGINGDGALAASLYEKFLSETAIFIPGAKELLNKCRGKIRVYIISNGTERVQTPRIKASGIDKMTDGHFISEVVGYNKPDIRYFEKVCAYIPGFITDQALVLGDSLTADISGGISYGLDTCLFDRNGTQNTNEKIKPDYIINELSGLYKILDI